MCETMMSEDFRIKTSCDSKLNVSSDKHIEEVEMNSGFFSSEEGPLIGFSSNADNQLAMSVALTLNSMGCSVFPIKESRVDIVILSHEYSTIRSIRRYKERENQGEIHLIHIPVGFKHKDWFPIMSSVIGAYEPPLGPPSASDIAYFINGLIKTAMSRPDVFAPVDPALVGASVKNMDFFWGKLYEIRGVLKEKINNKKALEELKKNTSEENVSLRASFISSTNGTDEFGEGEMSTDEEKQDDVTNENFQEVVEIPNACVSTYEWEDALSDPVDTENTDMLSNQVTDEESQTEIDKMSRRRSSCTFGWTYEALTMWWSEQTVTVSGSQVSLEDGNEEEHDVEEEEEKRE